jgi:hypothetical protein
MHLQIFIKVCNANFCTDQSCSFELCHVDRQTEGWMAKGKDTAKIIVTFFSCFANMPMCLYLFQEESVLVM